jgi:hypothetical protein
MNPAAMPPGHGCGFRGKPHRASWFRLFGTTLVIRPWLHPAIMLSMRKVMFGGVLVA